MAVNITRYPAAVSADPVEACIELILSWESVTMVDLEGVLLEKGVADDLEDDGWFVLYHLKNVIYWSVPNRNMSRILTSVIEDDRVDMRAVNEILYLIDGKHLSYPIARRPPKNGYKEPHWLPIRLVPAKGLENGN